MSMLEWPAQPTPGALVRLPLPLPPMLCEAVGYSHGGRYVALYWTAAGDELVYSDGSTTATGNWRPWRTLTDHALGLALLGPYRLGDSKREADHWLLADRWESTLDVGLADDVDALLASQPSEIAALPRGMPEGQAGELVDRAADAIAQRPSPADSEEITARLRREHELTDQLQRWLDYWFVHNLKRQLFEDPEP